MPVMSAPTLTTSNTPPLNKGENQPEDGVHTAEHERADNCGHESQSRQTSSGTGEHQDADGGDQKDQKGVAATKEAFAEKGGIDAPLASHEAGQSFGQSRDEDRIGRKARIEHFQVSLAISGVCCLIFSAASLKAVLSFVIVYALCWSARGLAAGLNRLFRRPALAGDPHVYWLMREFGTGRLTLALVAFCLHFAPSNPDIDIWLLAIMALAMCSALQAAYEDISVFGLIRTSTFMGGAS